MFNNDTDIIKTGETNDPTTKIASMKAIIGPDEVWDTHRKRDRK